MKFGKEFASQMVQEWQEAYTDYKHLKKMLKTISRFRQAAGKPKLPVHMAFSGLLPHTPKIKEDEPLFSATTPNQYQSLLMKLSEEGADHELAFFNKLDLEFDKVRAFHEGKLLAVKGGAQELTKQMDALIALRIKAHNSAPPDDVVASTATSSSPRASADGGNPGEVTLLTTTPCCCSY